MSDAARGVLASVFSDVTVPDFDQEPLSLSGIAVDVARSPSEKPTKTTRRAFRKSDNVRALLQIYQGIGRTDPIVPVTPLG